MNYLISFKRIALSLVMIQLILILNYYAKNKIIVKNNKIKRIKNYLQQLIEEHSPYINYY